ncbi:TPA: hypothetical protein OO042_003146, partial [Legionella pneumophila]|nr:hypothetical protein [Legionella pneumophila]
IHASEAVCPSSLSCDYYSGICETPSGWVLDTGGAVEDFSNQNIIELSKIASYKTVDKESTYDLRCQYSYGDHSVISIYTYVKSLTGSNWVFPGLEKNKAECSKVTDPTTCSGASQLNDTIAHKMDLQKIYIAASLTEGSSCGSACKQRRIRARGNSSTSYCLPKQDSPSGWGWVSDGNPQAALPLCECHPYSDPKNRYYVYCS